MVPTRAQSGTVWGGGACTPVPFLLTVVWDAGGCSTGKMSGMCGAEWPADEKDITQGTDGCEDGNTGASPGSQVCFLASQPPHTANHMAQ